MKKYIDFINENSNHQFKIGDRIIMDGQFEGNEFNNDIGTVVKITQAYYTGYILVQFDSRNDLHNGDGYSNNGDCFWLYPDVIKLYDDKPFEQFEDWDDDLN